MSSRPLTAEQKKQAVEAVDKYGTIPAAHKALKEAGELDDPQLSENAFRHRYRQGVKSGLDEAIVHPAPQGHEVKGVSTLYSADGQVISQWVKTRNDGISLQETLEAVREAFEGRVPQAPQTPAPDSPIANLATIYPLADWHVGLLAWHRETGDDWDLGIAQSVISDAMRRLIAGSPESEQCVVLGLGDLLHADNYQNRTSRSGHLLDVDGRYPKVLKVATELIIETVDRALAKHAKVLVRLIPGNHDDQSAIAVTLALAMRYYGDPRVTIDEDAGRFWWWRWGKVFLGAAHGDMAKMGDLPLLMASRNPDDWGASRHRLILTGHIHHRSKLVAAKEYGGVEVESFATPVAKDAWQYGMGYGGGQSVHSITFDREHGEVARSGVNIVTT